MCSYNLWYKLVAENYIIIAGFGIITTEPHTKLIGSLKSMYVPTYAMLSCVSLSLWIGLFMYCGWW